MCITNGWNMPRQKKIDEVFEAIMGNADLDKQFASFMIVLITISGAVCYKLVEYKLIRVFLVIAILLMCVIILILVAHITEYGVLYYG